MTDRPTIAELCAPLSAVPKTGDRRKTSTRIQAKLTMRRRGGAQVVWGNGEVLLPNTQARMVQLHNEGKTIPEIAAAIHTRPVYVYRLLSELREKGEIE